MAIKAINTKMNTGKKRDGGGSLGDWDYLGNRLDDQFFPDTSGDDAAAKEAMEKAIGEYTNLKPADLKPVDLMSIFDEIGDYKPVSSVEAPTLDAGPDVTYEGIDPRLADLTLAGDSDFNGIALDPRLKNTQLGALDSLQEIVDGGGLTAADEAALSKVQSDVSAADRGRRDAIRQNMAARGMGGSGLELLESLDSSQAATNRANQAGLDIAGAAEQRALDAMLKSGELAGSIRGQDFGEAADIAAANDAIDKFNASNSNQNAQWNAGATNSGNQFNATNTLNTALANRDNRVDVQKANATMGLDASKTNAAAANDAAYQTWNAKGETAANEKTLNGVTLPQERFDNDYKIASGKADAYGREQDYYNAQKAEKAGQGAAKAGLVGSVIGMFSDERVKKDIKSISDDEIEEFLGALKPKSFRYREPGTPGQGTGDRAGFVLQDVADTKIGKAITRKTDDGKLYVDRDNLDGVILAALSSFAKKGDAA